MEALDADLEWDRRYRQGQAAALETVAEIEAELARRPLNEARARVAAACGWVRYWAAIPAAKG